MLTTVADEHIVAATAATISFQVVDQHGDAADPAGAVTVDVAASDGTAIATDAATTGTGNGPRALQLTRADTATVDQLTATWKLGSDTLGTTTIDIIAKPLITKADFEARETKRAGLTDAAFRTPRREVTDLLYRECKRSFVPRFSVERIHVRNWTDTLVLRYPNLRRVAWANDEDGNAITVTSVAPNDSGLARQLDTWWPCGTITIGYEHGYDSAPEDLRAAVAKHIAADINDGNTSLPSRASSTTTPFGSTSFVPIAGYGQAITGIPKVDEAYNAHRWNAPGIA